MGNVADYLGLVLLLSTEYLSVVQVWTSDNEVVWYTMSAVNGFFLHLRVFICLV